MKDENVSFMSFNEALEMAAEVYSFEGPLKIARWAMRPGRYYKFHLTELAAGPILHFFIIAKYNNDHLMINYKLSLDDVLSHDWYVVTDERLESWEK
jgi:hypothetical protein